MARASTRLPESEPAVDPIGPIEGGAPPAPFLHPILHHLVTRGRLDPRAARDAMAAAADAAEPVVVAAVRGGEVTAAAWAEAAAELFGLERVAAEDLPESPPLGEQVSARFLRRFKVVPIAAEGGRLVVAVADPAEAYPLRALRLATDLEPIAVVATLEEIEATLARWFDRGPAALRRLVSDLDGQADGGGQEVERLIDSAQEAPVVRLVSQLLTDALHLKASDIHIEPFPDRLRVRYRIHGRLKEIASPPVRYAAAVVSRIKILAKLDIAERRLPQDGRARLELEGRRIDLRVATAPSVHGESLVIRLLEADRRGVALDEIGLDPDRVARLERILRSPHGMLLVTGPTGSGKTTTLYAALHRLDREALKVVSVEDPVEYQIEGVTQIHVRAEIGLDFARVLRSVVRHDPDVIMVGETRDPETADIAVHAALTGHLLLSTLHTNNAAGAVARLSDMGVEPYLLASVLRAVVGQRLVGVLCPHCREPHPADPAQRAFLAAAGITSEVPPILFRAPGCPRCDGQGIVGRLGIFELLEVDDTIRALIRERAPTQAIHQAAVAAGMRTMLQDGIAKALAGVTALEEVTRVTEDW
ncbi:MAG: ATPase, T2SS/T4P/T4SS family [Geminicoccaceae bacterium]|nr:ATPase, T2SS/T4P/T4SS family [Geminicoccaceae bacterium]